jgi:hypothetical protein
MNWNQRSLSVLSWEVIRTVFIYFLNVHDGVH